MGCMGMQKDASLGAGPVAPADPLFAEALSADAAAAVAWLTGPLPPTPQSLDVEDPVEQLSQPFHNLKIKVVSRAEKRIFNSYALLRDANFTETEKKYDVSWI